MTATLNSAPARPQPVCVNDFVDVCLAGDGDTTSLDWLRALLTDVEASDFAVQHEDPQAVWETLNHSRRFLEQLEALKDRYMSAGPWSKIAVDWVKLSRRRRENPHLDGYAPGLLILHGEEAEDGWVGLVKTDGHWVHFIPDEPRVCFGPRARLTWPMDTVGLIEWLDHRVCRRCNDYIPPAEFASTKGGGAECLMCQGKDGLS